MRRYRDEPVTDYRAALTWLWLYSEPDSWLDGGDLPPTAALVALIWWVNPADLRRHMRRLLGDERMDKEAA